MFFGSTPSVVSQYLAKQLLRVKPKRVYIPFAGNFVVEQIAATHCDKVQIHSTDVSLYSRLIGFGITGKESDLQLKPEYVEMFPIIGGDSSPLGKAIQALFFDEVSKALNNQDKEYFRILLDQAKDIEDQYYKKLRDKLTIVKDALKGKVTFHGIDAMQLTKDCEVGDFVFFDPPVLLGDYEKMFKGLEDCFEFENVPYTEMTRETTLRELERLSDIGCNVYYRTNNKLTDDLIPIGYKLVYMQPYKDDAEYCIYSNVEVDELHVGRFNALKTAPANFKLIGKEDTITRKSKVSIVRMDTKQANTYRLMWVKKAKMSSAGVAFGVVVDGKLIGVLQMQTGSGMKNGSDYAVIFSDPCVPYSKYSRLSKLVLALCCTQVFLDEFNKIFLWKHTGFTTRVFTDYDQSMKYRDLFTLVSKNKNTLNEYKWNIIYQNKDRVFPTYKAALTWWLDKHSKHLVDNEQ